jgi:hypothetical protein
MPAGKSRIPLEEGDIRSNEPKRVIAPQIDTCNYAEAISPAFDSNRALLRRVFFIGSDKTKYVSIGFYPTKNYQPMVELGARDKAPLLLDDSHVRLMADHLTEQCDALCNNEYYICRDGVFKMNTAGGYRVAMVSLGKQYIFFKLHEQKYLSYIFFMVRNQLTRYTKALPDVLNYIAPALYSTTYVEPSPTADTDTLYYQLFEELKSIV